MHIFRKLKGKLQKRFNWITKEVWNHFGIVAKKRKSRARQVWIKPKCYGKSYWEQIQNSNKRNVGIPLMSLKWDSK